MIERDNVSEARLSLLHPKVRDLALKAYREAVAATPKGVHPFVNEGMRTFERSNELYAQGRTKPGLIVSYAKAGQSYHNYGLALDFVNQIAGVAPSKWWKIDANWMKVVSIFKKYGFEWGGDWPEPKTDSPHFQMTFGNNWRVLLAKYTKGERDKDGYVIL